jgi:hypothetical protein
MSTLIKSTIDSPRVPWNKGRLVGQGVPSGRKKSRKLGRPAGTGTGDPPGAGYLTPLQIAQDYNFLTNSAADQTIGIFEDASNGAAYLQATLICV